MLKSKLAFGPISDEIVEAVFLFSHTENKQLMLISSRNQIDINHGYVCKTPEFHNRLIGLKQKYDKSDVLICRDHCGVGFGNPNHSLDGVRSTISSDIKYDFDLIHLDLCHLQCCHEEKLERTMELAKFALDLNPNIMFEIGTDENIGVAEIDTKRIESDVDFFLDISPVFYVVQTGSLVKENKNVGIFNEKSSKYISKILQERNVLFKEHNADYLPSKDIKRRRKIVDAMNIAPQLGVIQTSVILHQCLIYGIDTSDFCKMAYDKQNWRKWVLTGNETNKQLCILLSGHYHFNSDEYIDLVGRLGRYIPVKDCIIEEILKVINHYDRYMS